MTQGDHVVIGDNDRLVKVYDARDKSLIRTLDGNKDLVRAVAIDTSARIVVSGGYDHSIRMWDLDSGELIRKIKAGEDLVFGVGMQCGRLVL